MVASDPEATASEFYLQSHELMRGELFEHIQYRRRLEARTPILIAAVLVWIFTYGADTADWLRVVAGTLPLLIWGFESLRFKNTQQKVAVHIEYLTELENLLQDSRLLGFENWLQAEKQMPRVTGWAENKLSELYWPSLGILTTVAAIAVPIIIASKA